MQRNDTAVDCCARGDALFKTRKYVEATAEYTRALELDKRYAIAYQNRGIAYLYQKRHGEAILDFTRAYELNPKLQPNYAYLVRQLDYSKEYIFKLIKKMPPEKQISLLRRCLNKNTLIGARFWEQEGLINCSATTGTLGEIVDQLKKLMPLTNIPDKQRIVFFKPPTPKGARCENQTFNDTTFDFHL